MRRQHGVHEIGVIEPQENAKWRDLKFTLPDSFGNKGWVEIVLESDFSNIEQIVPIENYTIVGNNSGGIADGLIDNSSVSVFGNEIIASAGDTDATLTVCDIAGRVTVAPTKIEARQTRRFSLTPGLYIVRLNSKATRIVVR